eukprot:jgi/Ulvmu1/11232/UM073_0004.1
MRSLCRAPAAVLAGSTSLAPCQTISGVEHPGQKYLMTPERDQDVSCSSRRRCWASISSRCHQIAARAAQPTTDSLRDYGGIQPSFEARRMHTSAIAVSDAAPDAPNSVAAALAAQPPAPPLPYDSDENSVSGPGEAPFVPPQIDKLIRMIMRHGKKEQARRIVFDATHAMYNSARAKNPRPELKQRHKDFQK